MRRILAALGVLTLAFLAGGISVRAGDVTYNMVNDPVDQNGFELSGTIVTDGNIGALTSSDVVSWQFTITGPGGPFSNSGTGASLERGDLLGLAATTSGDLTTSGFVLLGVDFNDASSTGINWQPDADTYYGAVGGNLIWVTGQPPFPPPTGFPAAGAWTIATAAASVPEPSSVVLAGLGCASAIAFGLARKRSDYRRHANTTK
jgi:PEP-CTERM motif